MNKVANEQFKSNERLFMNAFLELLEKKDISKITVRELCEKTNLNRTTFYNHYLDVYDLLDKIGEQHNQNIYALFSKGHSKNGKENLRLILNYMKDNQIFYRASLNSFESNRLKEGFILLIKKRILEHTKSSSINAEYQGIFLANGMLSSITYWLNNDCNISVDKMCNMLSIYFVHA